jgi:hypothetical protein
VKKKSSKRILKILRSTFKAVPATFFFFSLLILLPTKMSEQPELLELKKGMEFPDKEALDAHRDAYGKQENICIVTDRSDLVGGFITWRCKHGKQYRSAKGSEQHVKKITKNNDN